MKPTKCPAKEKKKRRQEKGEEREERKRKVRTISKFCFLRMPELRKLIFSHLNQKAAKCTTCKWLCGKF